MVPVFLAINKRKAQTKKKKGEPGEYRSLEEDYVKAFACKSRRGVASARATTDDEDLGVLL